MHSTVSSQPPRAPAPLLVSLSFRPVYAYIDGVRELGRFFCEKTFKQPELVERAQVVLQETLENAIKYCSLDKDTELELEIASDGAELKISTLSHPDPLHLQSLREEIEMLRKFDPEAAFIAAFARAAREPGTTAKLGLARMRYESQFELRVHEEPGGAVRVTAVGKL